MLIRLLSGAKNGYAASRRFRCLRLCPIRFRTIRFRTIRPFNMTLTMPLRLIRLLRRLYHYLVYVAGGGVIAVCIVALAFKFWLMPNVQSYQGVLETAASKALGQTVQIGMLEADWSGLNPRLILRDIRVRADASDTDASAAPPLYLPRVEAAFSWLSLALFDLRLAHLTLDQPHLQMRRDKAGLITVAGMPMNQAGEASAFPDWLLRQPRIIIKDAEILWLDEKLKAPDLRVSGVRFLLENRFGRHRFGGIANPTAAAARRFELRGDLKGRSLRDWSEWVGEIFVRIDGARFESWGRWVPWAQESVRSGTGDMRFWVALNQGAVQGVSGDARLGQVAINIDKALPDLMFDTLSGHAGWTRKQAMQTFYVDRLRFKIPGEAVSEPAAVRVNLTPDGRGGAQRVGVSARNLRLEALTALTSAFPIPKRGHDLIEALNPRGMLAEGEGHWSGPKDYAIKLDIQAAGLNAYQKFPGIQGLGAKITADQHSGKAAFDGRGMKLALPAIFRHDLSFSQFDAAADWLFDTDGLKLNFAAQRLLNPDLDGHAKGHLVFPGVGPNVRQAHAPDRDQIGDQSKGPIVVDITAHLRRGEAKAVYRYLPREVGDKTYHWLQQSLLAGQSDDVNLVLKGPLDRFPFDQGGGEFKVAIKMLDGVLEYAPGWPRIEGINGMLVFHDKAMTLTAESGKILDARLGPVKVSLADLHISRGFPLLIDGEANGETRAFLDFIKYSPVHAHTNRFTEPFSTEGEGHLDIQLQIPLQRIETTTLQGSYRFDNNRLDPGGDLPELSGVSGSVEFTQDTLQAKNIRAQVLDLPVSLNIESAVAAADGDRKIPLHVQLLGDINPTILKPHLPPALLGRIEGSARWQAEIGMHTSGNSGLTLTSDLVGLAINLPPPFGKAADKAVPLLVVKESSASGAVHEGTASTDAMNAVFARYGDLLTMRAQSPAHSPANTPTNKPVWVHLRFGSGEASAPTESGLKVSGAMRQLDLDAWRKLDLGIKAGPGASVLLPLREVSLAFNELQILNRRLNDTHVKLRPVGGGWRVALAGREINGEIMTIPVAEKISLLANFKRLSLPDLVTAKTPGVTYDVGLGVVEALPKSITDVLAGFELSSESTLIDGHDLGELHLRLSPDKSSIGRGFGLRMDNLTLSNPDGQLRGKGVLANHPRRQSQFQFELESNNFGNLLDRLGMPGRIKRGAGRISGPLRWTGGVESFGLTKLAGNLQLDLKQGQFTRIEPGAGKLLGILSLQSLPRRIALDFRDVFSDGFAFDEIVGDLYLERGIGYFNDLQMSGPAAKVKMSGMADLARETQNLRVTIQPRLEDTVAMAGALLGGPVVGVGTFIANKILRNPIGQAVTFEYAITGAWADPVVTKLARPHTKGEG